MDSVKEINDYRMPGILRKIKIYNESLRLKEILLIGGVTFIGLISNTHSFDLHIFSLWIAAMLCSYCLLGYAFLSNDWSGFEYDKNDPNKKNRPLIKGEISLSEIKFLCIILLIASLIFAALLSYLTLIIAAAIALLNYLYSGNKVLLKSVPVASSLLHGLGATLGFLIGYTFQGNVSQEGILFGIYFGIIYAAGHLNHEISDSESDKKSSIITNASILGKRKAFITSFILFSFSFIYIFFLSLKDLLPSALIFGIVPAFLSYTYFFYKTFKTKLDYKSMIIFRKKYRIIFLLWGVFFAIILFYKYTGQ